MQKIRFKMAVLLSLGYLLTSGCGGGENLGGNVGEFKTATVTAVSATPRLEADLINGNTCSATGSAGGTIETESVDFTITTKATTSNPLPLSITGYTVTYVPKNAGAPALAPLTSNFSTSGIIPGASLTIPVAVTTDLQKVDLITANPDFPCSLTILQYDVNVSFNVVEVGSGEGSKSVNAGFVMAIADRN